MVLPFIILFFHTFILFLASLPLNFTKLEKAIISQSLIGGAGTAVALAQSKNWKQGVLIGMVLGLLGYAIGNYVGIACYHSSLYLIQHFL